MFYFNSLFKIYIILYIKHNLYKLLGLQITRNYWTKYALDK